MATLVLRTVQGRPLTNQEVDDNFNNLNTEVGLKLDTSSYTAADILTKLKTVDGLGSGLDADLLDGYNQDTANTANALVRRNSNGDFAANTITANGLIGPLTGNVTGNLVGTVTGNATNVSGIVAVNNGGTGSASASGARDNLGLGTIATQNSSSISITGGTITGITALAINVGGTGAVSASQARSNLGVVPGSDVQQYSTELASLAAASSTGIYARIGAGSTAQRTLVSNSTSLSIINSDGVSGNPTFSLNTQLTALASTSLSTDTVPYYTGSSTASTTALTSYGRTLIGLADATALRTNLALVVGTNVQAWDSDLDALGTLATTGLMARTASNVYTTRTITAADATHLTITNGNGVSGNPTIAIASTADITIAKITTTGDHVAGGSVISANAASMPSITKTGTNGSGDIGQSGNRFFKLYAVQHTSYYADLAEKYTTDSEYEPGTVVVVSKDEAGAEATQSYALGQRILGVVSTNPAFIMNDEAPGQEIGLRGRLPVKVVGPIKKGQPLISTPDGKATFGDEANSFAIALHTNNDAGVKLVECVLL
jgi:hypothetical protein